MARRRFRARSLIAGGWLLVVAGLAVPAAFGASPSPSAAVAPPGAPPSVQAWLDAEVTPPDAPPGGVLEAGFSFWSTRMHEFFPMGGVYVRMHPKSGSGAPSEATLDEDFPGHVVASMVVPQGGAGDVEVGIRESSCTDLANCAGQEARFEIAGVGPPPDATVETLVRATIRPLVGDTVAGRAFPVTVNIAPRGLWSLESVALPDDMLVVARRPGGPELSTGELHRSSDPGAAYAGELTVPEAGEVEIAVAVPLEGGGLRTVDGSTIDRIVIEGGPGASPGPASTAEPAPASPGFGAEGSGIPPVVLIVGVAVLVVVGFVALNRLLADL